MNVTVSLLLSVYSTLWVGINIKMKQRLFSLHCPVYIQHSNFIRRFGKTGVCLALGIGDKACIFQRGHQLPDIGRICFYTFCNLGTGQMLFLFL